MNRRLAYSERSLLEVLFVSAAIVLLSSAFCSAADRADSNHEIVILNSYHHGYRWSDGEAAGVVQELTAALPRARIYHEFLGTKQVPVVESNREYYEKTAEALRHKYRLGQTDLVIALDSDALSFLNNHAERIWPNIPIVFCGVEEVRSEMTARLREVSGIMQLLDMPGTVHLARQLMPSLTTLWVLCEDSPTGAGMRRELEEIPASLKAGLSLEFPKPESYEKLFEQTKTLGTDTAILYLVLGHDLAGHVMEPAEFLSRLGRESSVPIFILTEDRLVDGVVGGALLSAVEHGREAGRMAVNRLLNPATFTPKIIGSASGVVMLDYRQLQRFNWDDIPLPAGARVLFKPPSLYQRYPLLFTVTLPVTIGLSSFVLVLLLNIRRRRQVEAALRESETKYRRLFASMHEGVALCEFTGSEPEAADYRVIEANPAFLALFGLAPDIVGKPASDVWKKESPPFLTPFNTMRRNARDWTGEATCDQGRRTFRLNCFVLEGHRFAVVLDDVSDRKKSERTLYETLNMLNTVISASPSPIITFDADGRVSLWNHAAEKTFGHIATELLGRPLPFLDEPDQKGFLQRVREAHHQQPPSFEWTYAASDGSRKTFLVSVGSLGGSTGSQQGYLAMFLDVTGVRIAQREQQRLEEQLQQVQKLESLGRLAGGIAHDFNNQLTTIIGNSEMLRDELRSQPENLSLVEEILAAGRRSGVLTEQLLTFSRRQAFVPQVLDVNTLIARMQKTLTRLLGETITLNFEQKASDCFIKVDAGLFEQALMNLAINSRDAMPNGGILEFRTSRIILKQPMQAYVKDVPPGEYVVVDVVDTGHGMDAKVLENLFDPFFTTKPIGKGTGLGLAMVYGFVQQHQGYIQVNSRPGSGTRFSLFFSAERRPSEAPAAAPAPAVEKLPAYTLLIVEDELPVQKMMQRILKLAGFEVLVAANGREALNVFAEAGEKVDLVITDIVMPEMGGLELAARLWEKRPELKVVLSSGYGEQALEHTSFPREKVRVIGKPFPTDQLLSLIRTFLGKPAV